MTTNNHKLEENSVIMTRKIKTIVVGCGNMGASHARAYKKLDGFHLAGLVDTSASTSKKLSEELGGIPYFVSLDKALGEIKPDAVSVCTYPETHASIALKSLRKGAHIFVEKPLATSVRDAIKVVETAHQMGRKLVIGYILRVHPSWKKFIELAQALGKPLVMRMNLNQQSSGKTWVWHLNLMKSMPPIVDCGVHYVDVMCQMTQSKPVRVSAIGARLSGQISKNMYNYGQLIVTFKDGSVGWYEAGWGPMMSQTAFFVKDVIGPKGSVSITDAGSGKDKRSDDIDSHTKTNRLLLHHSEMGKDGSFARKDEIISTEDEPDHQGLCNLEQEFFYNSIMKDMDLTNHQEDAINSLRIVLAADKAFRTGKTVNLK
jgi:predicted dehydrogenase